MKGSDGVSWRSGDRAAAECWLSLTRAAWTRMSPARSHVHKESRNLVTCWSPCGCFLILLINWTFAQPIAAHFARFHCFFDFFLHLPNEKIHVSKCGLKIFLVLFILANKESHYYPGISSRFPLGFFSKHRLCSSEGSIFHQCCFSVAIKMARGNISRGMSQKRIKNNLRVHLGPCAYRSHSIKMQTEIGANSQLPTFKSNKHGSIPDLGLC